MRDAPELVLDAEEREMLAGAAGGAAHLAMELIVEMAKVARATRLVPVRSAHIDGCLYHGSVGLDFAERLAREGGRVRVPTTLNVSSLDLLHPELVRLEPTTRQYARRLMAAYEAMGCRPTWTCAPYQLPERPAFGEHVAWAESNAIVFANSVLGARTERYGDFIDICAALTGRVPFAGLHRNDERGARLIVRLMGVAPEAWVHDEAYALLGHALGRLAGDRVPAVVGLPTSTTEDQLKALGAAAASSGSVALCHVVGVTPEAPTLEACLAADGSQAELEIGPGLLRAAWQELSNAVDGQPLAAVSLGTPHLSLAEWQRLQPLLEATDIAPGLTLYVSTARHVAADIEARGQAATLHRPGVQLVVDTCTYITPIITAPPGATVMTNSAKWAWYTPANLGLRVAFGTLEDCLRSAAHGRVLRRPPAWLDG
ncbi:MAG TPA: aconitase X catalytic domain-containing protein [Candidatus Limnocylindria bacterium]|nr:aconitase X catalytic domain-containing protein [Candidatus Limnocylindria bacterium]